MVAAAPLLISQPEFAALHRAYSANRAKDYYSAVSAFSEAISQAPLRADIRKDLAYSLLKVGENEDARQQFRRAMELDPNDESVALEFAFLTFEVRSESSANKALARQVFDRVRRTGNKIAELAFQNIDQPLAQSIERWTRAIQLGSESFSAHYELAQLAEQRGDVHLAAEHYLQAWQLTPARKNVLIDLARVQTAANQPQEAIAALLAASRGGEPRAAEQARELLPARYPYVYEFRQAVLLDPANAVLHRELAYLLLAMKDPEAEEEFDKIVKSAPDDLVSAAQLGLLRLARTATNPNTMGNRSLQAGFLKDALRYFNVAYEADPEDYGSALKLGWTYNMLHDDRSAREWFEIARNSPVAAVAKEAALASENLRTSSELVRSTVWVLPFYSTRWHAVLGYGQIKTELNLGSKWIRPYLSTRIIADTRPSDGGPALSERSLIAAVGLVSQWHGFTGWAEAGSAIRYTDGGMRLDYRGGVSWARRWTLNSNWFLEANADEVFVSRFGNDWLSYSQNRFGYKWFLFNGNVTVDSNRQHWGNFAEAGPGIRIHVPSTPKRLLLSVDYLRGLYLVSDGNSQHAKFTDLRIGFWYAATK